MLLLGEKQTLQVIKRVDFGVYLKDPKEASNEERVLLPIKQVPKECKIGDLLSVFLYKDSKDRLIATTKEPTLTLHQVKPLQVAQTGKIGAFLNWGLEKDLLLPFKEQTKRVNPGEECLVALYIDKSERLCATMKVYHYLETDSPYEKEQRVEGRVYEISDNFGAFVAIDNRYSGCIPKKELYGDVKVGEWISARIIEVREDGKLTLSVREKAYLQIETDAKKILSIIEEFDGVLPFNDKASPEVIKRETGMSKNEFKRAVGNLLKAKKIVITEKAIRLV